MSLKRALPILLYSRKFPEIKAFSVKFPEIRKNPENLRRYSHIHGQLMYKTFPYLQVHGMVHNISPLPHPHTHTLHFVNHTMSDFGIKHWVIIFYLDENWPYLQVLTKKNILFKMFMSSPFNIPPPHIFLFK